MFKMCEAQLKTITLYGGFAHPITRTKFFKTVFSGCPVWELSPMTRIQATCTQYCQVNDKFFRNRYLYCTMFALFASLDTAVVYFVKLSR